MIKETLIIHIQAGIVIDVFKTSNKQKITKYLKLRDEPEEEDTDYLLYNIDDIKVLH